MMRKRGETPEKNLNFYFYQTIRPKKDLLVSTSPYYPTSA
ncbi:TIFY9 [Arabidopsis thaliana]|uniref:TIFY9 n=1 Tax=Arabidopsis thaliana TaxID=3702 RepID=A0A178UCV8_ARATH|nr:TIFY9 [Arabidopsis thaliana]